MTQKAAANIFGVSTTTLSDQLHRSIKRHRDGHRIRGVKHIGLDEISFKKGRKYATLVYDLDTSKVIWIGQGKGRRTIDEFFKSQLSDYQKQQIEAACCDMSQAYVGAQTGSIGAKATNQPDGPPRYDFTVCWHGAGWAPPPSVE